MQEGFSGRIMSFYQFKINYFVDDCAYDYWRL